MFELAFGAAWSGDRSLEKLRDSLLWLDLLGFEASDAVEGARIQAELQEKGKRIPVSDVMLAGVARNRGATLVAADDHFDEVDGIVVEEYRES